MLELFAHPGLVTILAIAAALLLVTLCVVIVSLGSLAARRPATRRHCLAVLGQLTRYAETLRARR